MPTKYLRRCAAMIAAALLVLNGAVAQEDDEEDSEEETKKERPERAPADRHRQLLLRLGGYFPADLPTDQGVLAGIEYRTLLNDRSGLAFSLSVFSESADGEVKVQGTGGANRIVQKAEIKIQPLLVSWFRIWKRERQTFYAGAGGGVYLSEITVTSSGAGGIGVVGAGDFSLLSDDPRIGACVYGGAEFFPQSRWGFAAEGRFHLVESSFSAGEATVAGLLRF